MFLFFWDAVFELLYVRKNEDQYNKNIYSVSYTGVVLEKNTNIIKKYT